MTGEPPNLNRLMSLEAPTRVADGAGGYAESWLTLGRLWARLEPRTGRAFGAEEAGLGSVRFRIIVRGAAPTSPQRPRAGHVLREGPRRFLIEAVAEADGAARYLTCFAREEEVAQ